MYYIYIFIYTIIIINKELEKSKFSLAWNLVARRATYYAWHLRRTLMTEVYDRDRSIIKNPDKNQGEKKPHRSEVSNTGVT
jgi:hypothetical protein